MLAILGSGVVDAPSAAAPSDFVGWLRLALQRGMQY
jgi:hypothetical protein